VSAREFPWDIFCLRLRPPYSCTADAAGTNTNANTAPPHRAGGAARASTTATNVVLLNKARNAATRRAIIWETRRCKILRNAGTERQRHQFESAHITMAARVRRRAAEADPRSTEPRGLEGACDGHREGYIPRLAFFWVSSLLRSSSSESSPYACSLPPPWLRRGNVLRGWGDATHRISCSATIL